MKSRPIFSLFVLALFLANTSIVFAGYGCMHDADTTIIKTEITITEASSACHKTEGKHHLDKQHHGSSCLCSSISSSCQLFLNASQEIHNPVSIKQCFLINNDALVSLDQTPPKPPPKYIF